MSELGYSNMSVQDIEKAYKSLDYNRNGIIDYNEFRTWFLSGHHEINNFIQE